MGRSEEAGAGHRFEWVRLVICLLHGCLPSLYHLPAGFHLVFTLLSLCHFLQTAQGLLLSIAPDVFLWTGFSDIIQLGDYKLQYKHSTCLTSLVAQNESFISLHLLGSFYTASRMYVRGIPDTCL